MAGLLRRWGLTLSWQTVYKGFARWAQLSVWDNLLEELADSESISIDASYVKLHQHGTGAKGGTSHKRSGEVKAD
jgi:hypothetical protein